MTLAALFCSCAKPEGPGAKPAPDVGLSLLQADKPALSRWSELRGQAVVLEFWSTWCEPCVEEMPRLAALAAKFEGRPMRFISVSDEPRSTVAEFLKTHSIPGWVAYDGGEAFRAFKVRGRPQTVLLDAQGRVAARTYPTQVTEAVLENLLAGRGTGLVQEENEPQGAAAEKGEAILSVRISLAEPAAKRRVMRSGPGMFETRNLPLSSVLPQIYETSSQRLVPPPDLSAASYDIAASVPRGADVHALLRQAVEATFGLKSRKERRMADVYVLRSASGRPGPGLRSSESKTAGGYSTEEGDFSVEGQSMPEAAVLLGEAIDKNVVDETGLRGRYSFELKWEKGKMESLRKALRENLGFELAAGRRAIEVVVVERAASKSAKRP
ncbi:MAG: TIGR03435 family protein [Elusimicrobia bacterium]|nr:TIGR03435 family protein [Elusimicrobiota bacterium]